MAVSILTDNSILVYAFATSRRNFPFEINTWAHNASFALRPLFAFQKERLKIRDYSVDKNQFMRQRRIGLEFYQILLWALVFGHYFSVANVLGYNLCVCHDHFPALVGFNGLP